MSNKMYRDFQIRRDFHWWVVLLWQKIMLQTLTNLTNAIFLNIKFSVKVIKVLRIWYIVVKWNYVPIQGFTCLIYNGYDDVHGILWRHCVFVQSKRFLKLCCDPNVIFLCYLLAPSIWDSALVTILNIIGLVHLEEEMQLATSLDRVCNLCYFSRIAICCIVY